MMVDSPVRTYFAGRLGGEAGLMIGVVDDRTEIELPETMFGQLR